MLPATQTPLIPTVEISRPQFELLGIWNLQLNAITWPPNPTNTMVKGVGLLPMPPQKSRRINPNNSSQSQSRSKSNHYQTSKFGADHRPRVTPALQRQKNEFQLIEKSRKACNGHIYSWSTQLLTRKPNQIEFPNTTWSTPSGVHNS